jgi:tripartite-type tricarboxylate transporter receptor subunit TctC
MIHIPYKGDNPAIADLIAGQIQLLFATGLVLTPQINAGKLRGLAVTTEKRSPANPDLPAIGELVPGYAVDGWTGMWAPAGTPKTVIAKLNQALARILKQPDVQERLRAGGAQPTPCTPDEYARLISRDIAKWTKVVKTGNIRIN